MQTSCQFLAQRPIGHRYHPYAESQLRQSDPQPRNRGWNAGAEVPEPDKGVTDQKNCENSLNIPVVGTPSSESAHPRNIQEFSWPPLAVEDIPLPMGSPPTGPVHLDPPFYSKVMSDIDQGLEEKPELSFEESRHYVDLGLPYIKLEPLPEEESLLPLPTLRGLESGPETKNSETFFHHPATSSLQEIKPDPRNLQEIWDELFGPSTKKEAEVPHLDDSTTSCSSSGKLPLLSPLKIEGENFYKNEENWTLEEPEDLAFSEGENLTDLLKQYEAVRLQLPVELSQTEIPQSPVTDPSVYMQNLICTASTTEKRPRFCQKCQNHNVFRPWGQCQRQKGRACPYFDCNCKECKDVDGARAVARRYKEMKKNRENLLQKLLILPNQPGAARQS